MRSLKSWPIFPVLFIGFILYAVPPARALECSLCKTPKSESGPMVFSFRGLSPGQQVVIKLDGSANFTGSLYKGVEKMSIACSSLLFTTPADTQSGDTITLSVGVVAHIAFDLSGKITDQETGSAVKGRVDFQYGKSGHTFSIGAVDTVDGRFTISSNGRRSTCYPCDCRRREGGGCPYGLYCVLRYHEFCCCLINPYE